MGIGSRSIPDLFIHTNASIPPEREATLPPSLRINNSPSASPVSPPLPHFTLLHCRYGDAIYAINSPCNNESANDPLLVVLIASERASGAFVRGAAPFNCAMLARCVPLSLSLSSLPPSFVGPSGRDDTHRLRAPDKNDPLCSFARPVFNYS